MEIINVVTIKVGLIDEIKSFGVFDESKKQEVVDEAEEYFKQKVILNGALPTDMDIFLEDGYYSDGSDSVCITWSEI